MPLDVRYAQTQDGSHVAYGTWGAGDFLHVFAPEFGASVDGLGQHPAHLRYERFLGSLSRCVCLDPRGIGGSDPTPLTRLGAPEDWAVDLLAVLDALGADRVVVTGEGFSAHAAVSFAVRHPERVLRLMLLNPYARLTASDNYTIGSLTEDDVEAFAETLSAAWGTGQPHVQFAPALASDPTFLEVCGRIERIAASPATVRAMVRAMGTSDIRGLLAQINVPTLVYYTGDLAHVAPEHSRFVAESIPGATLLEAPGRSFYQPDETGNLDAWAEFIVGGVPKATERRLAAILFVDVVDSTAYAASIGDRRWADTLDDLDAWVLREVERRGGHLVKQTGDGQLATFDRPGDALAAAHAIARGVHVLGMHVRCGVHVGEIEARPGGDIGGIAVHLAARLLTVAEPSQVVVSRTVVELVAGGGFTFKDSGVHKLKGVPGSVQLYRLTGIA